MTSRRVFIKLLGGAAAGWPLAARAQQAQRMRRIGVLMNTAEGDPEGHARLTAFREALERLGWTEKDNIRFDYRWAPAGGAEARRFAEELVELEPDLIFANSTPVTVTVKQTTARIPVVLFKSATRLSLTWCKIFTSMHRRLILSLMMQYRLPALYPFKFWTAEGGLMVYGVDVLDICRRAATYVDRVLRGANPADLPVQAPTKDELVINLKTAKAIGLTVPDKLLVAADEVIE